MEMAVYRFLLKSLQLMRAQKSLSQLFLSSLGKIDSAIRACGICTTRRHRRCCSSRLRTYVHHRRKPAAQSNRRRPSRTIRSFKGLELIHPLNTTARSRNYRHKHNMPTFRVPRCIYPCFRRVHTRRKIKGNTRKKCRRDKFLPNPMPGAAWAGGIWKRTAAHIRTLRAGSDKIFVSPTSALLCVRRAQLRREGEAGTSRTRVASSPPPPPPRTRVEQSILYYARIILYVSCTAIIVVFRIPRCASWTRSSRYIIDRATIARLRILDEASGLVVEASVALYLDPRHRRGILSIFFTKITCRARGESLFSMLQPRNVYAKLNNLTCVATPTTASLMPAMRHYRGRLSHAAEQ
ncbi:unnamed protein product [Trichogramma brassicae]|uniref:Uncharacterized protein n=1 Tax=Trichogramma brassicae TaxID=86971 RepID=A0A6H5HWS3_9HYME|nr:unnamed protein product [Trichogramma brassicae]